MTDPSRQLLTDPHRDLSRLTSLASRLWGGPAARWHPGELVWARFQHLGREPEWPTAWWRNGDTTVGWAWVEQPDSLNPALDPAHPELADSLLDWFEATAERPGSVTVLETESALIAALDRRGWRRRDTGPFFIHLRRSLTALPDPVVPDGYRLRPVSGAEDAAERAAAHRAAFSRPDRPSRVSTDSYRQLMGANGYRHDLDWVVETSDGGIAAFCLVWWDPASRSACLEPVGCRPEHRRRGLAAAASLAALHAVARLGAEHARVCARGDDAYPGPRALYESLGFRRYAEDVSFVR